MRGLFDRSGMNRRRDSSAMNSSRSTKWSTRSGTPNGSTFFARSPEPSVSAFKSGTTAQ
jgi:hypothetical protein